MVNKDLCIKCNLCISVCPFEAIVSDDEGYAYIDYEKCTKCLACEGVCPTVAIDIKG